MPANRIVLAGASEYFFTMFSVDMKEKKAEEIQIGDVVGDTLKALVNFCYTGKIKITSDNVVRVLSAASMLLFHHIQKECEKHLIDQLMAKPELSLCIYKIAHGYSFPELIRKSFEMIGKNFRSLVKMDFFCAMDYPLLSHILCSDTEVTANEEETFEAAMKWVNFDAENREKFIPDILHSIRLVHIDASVMLFLFLFLSTYYSCWKLLEQLRALNNHQHI